MVRAMRRTIAGAFLSGVLLAGCGSDNPSPAAPTPSPSPSPAPAPTASRLDVSASPTLLLLSGSTVTVTARLVDSAGAPLAGRTIQLSTNSGTLSATTG